MKPIKHILASRIRMLIPIHLVSTSRPSGGRAALVCTGCFAGLVWRPWNFADLDGAAGGRVGSRRWRRHRPGGRNICDQFLEIIGHEAV